MGTTPTTMPTNVGGMERLLRIIAGIAILVVGPAMIGMWALIGVIPILTGSLGWCPMYLPFGINTNSNQ
jgi:hypothetical protein